MKPKPDLSDWRVAILAIRHSLPDPTTARVVPIPGLAAPTNSSIKFVTDLRAPLPMLEFRDQSHGPRYADWLKAKAALAKRPKV